MANNNIKNVANTKIPEMKIPAISEVQGQLWDLNRSLRLIIANYHTFNAEISWTHYGEIIMLRDSMAEADKYIQVILKKLEKGDKD